jgi:hypothetical protein
MIASTKPEAHDRAAAVLADLTQRGFRLRARGPQLLVSPLSKLSSDDRDALRANRAELLRLLPDSRSGLEIAIERTAAELVEEAGTLASMMPLVAEIRHGERLAFLVKLAHITLRLRKVSAWLCERCDEADERSKR